MDHVQDYDYHLPEELIAHKPAARRESARLLLMDRTAGCISHHAVSDLPVLLSAGDCLILNNTRVLPARLFGYREQTGGKWEGLYLGTPMPPDGTWKLIGQTRGRLTPGELIGIHSVTQHSKSQHSKSQSQNQLALRLLVQQEDGIWLTQPIWNGSPLAALQQNPELISEILNQFGTMPLPPYIGKDIADEEDWQRYQTTYATQPGAVAAPTAGLHFTPQLLDQCAARGIPHHFVTLHVGLGTFRPINTEKLSEHVMHKEWGELTAGVAQRIIDTKKHDGRVVCVGTTGVRVLETAFLDEHSAKQGWHGETDLFIRPPYRFQAVDVLLTNFHLPKSTLLALVSAFAGFEFIREAYQVAIREKYRFYSYGDAMLIV